ncbi:MAG: prepilin peptidase [Clostridia bacterium]|jgi:leader peptidase (prepilin peptidase)/N-methyltransferase
MFILFFIIGLILGSFYTVCIERIPRQMSLVTPRSHCSSCERTLQIYDLIPVVSYLLLKGKCRCCNARISLRYPIVELLTGILFGGLYLKYSLRLSFFVYAALTSVLLVAAFIDLEHRIIPNGLVLFGSIIALIFNILQLHVNWLDGLLGMLTGSGILLLIAWLSLILLKKEGMGGGDIKLMGMIGLFLGCRLTLLSLVLSIYIGGFIGGMALLTRRRKAGDYIPYGPFIALGTLVAIFFGREILLWYFSRFGWFYD